MKIVSSLHTDKSHWIKSMKITTCRICGNEQLNSIFELGKQALTGRFPRDPGEDIPVEPLSLFQCDLTKGCGLVQLQHSYDLGELYGDTYGYRSGLNKSMVEHLKAKVLEILSRDWLSDGDIVLDIGSNDGTTLGHYPQSKYKLIGIDPSAKKFAKYYREDIVFVSDFFTAANFRAHFPNENAKVITSFSMFYDLESPVDFAKDVAEILAFDGVWCFEQSYMPAMLAANSFDTICHEHIEYYGLSQIVNILNRVDMHVLDVSFNDVNGGSFTVVAGKKAASHVVDTETVSTILANEHKADFASGGPFTRFREQVEIQRESLMAFLKSAKDQGKSVFGLGASTKGNVLLQYYGITHELITAIAEVNQDKYDCFTPGTLIPILPQDAVLAENPDYLLVLPWHFRHFFETLPSLQGRTLIFPLPTFEVVKIGR